METWGKGRRHGMKMMEQRAVKVCAPRGVRTPENLPPEHVALANRALQRIVDVMEEEVHSKRAKGVLSAAIEIREEICGPKTQKISIEGSLEQILTASLAAPESAIPSLPPDSRPSPALAEVKMADEMVIPDQILDPES